PGPAWTASSCGKGRRSLTWGPPSRGRPRSRTSSLGRVGCWGVRSSLEGLLTTPLCMPGARHARTRAQGSRSPGASGPSGRAPALCEHGGEDSADAVALEAEEEVGALGEGVHPEQEQVAEA